MSEDLAARKARLRTAALLTRREAARTVAGAAAALAVRAGEIPQGAIIGGYLPVRDEIDPRPLMRALATGAEIALPRVEGDTMRFLLMGEGDVIERGRFGLAEPSGGTEVVPEVILVPLLAFARDGARLGYGKGYYDRWLAAHPGCRTVGLAYAAQELDALPIEPHDQPLDAILTETGVIEVRG